jgi:threonyl-tRNA synthetase
MGTVENWDLAEKALASAFERQGRPYVIHAGDGAFYGPKLDFQVTDAIGRAWQLGTLQVDFSNPEQFDLHYTAEDGSKKRPVVLHRAVLGSLERFFGILIEHTGGDFPLWLAPEQARVIPVSDKLLDYSRSVAAALREAGLRVTIDERNEKLGAKIRHGELEKVPVLLVVGEKEREAGAVSVRRRHAGDLGSRPLVEVLSEMKQAVAARAATWGAPAPASQKTSS